MVSSELFLLFPRGVEVKGQPFYLKEIEEVSTDVLVNVGKEIDSVTLLLRGENYDGYYDLKNVDAFLFAVSKDIDVERPIRYHITRFRRIISKWGKNWREEQTQSLVKEYKYYAHNPIKDDTLSEITERVNIAHGEKTFLLINCKAIECKASSITTTCNEAMTVIDVCDLNVRPISEWFVANRMPQRKFNLNPKHGERGKGAYSSRAGEKVSTLNCTRDEAEILLLRALGTSKGSPKTLYSFDTQCGQYIEFKHEVNNEYHGFHLDKNDEGRVPNDIKRLLNELLN